MGVGRLAPQRVRAKYARALAEIPLPVRSFADIDPSTLTKIGEATVADRMLWFGVIVGVPRVWVAFADNEIGDQSPGCPRAAVRAPRLTVQSVIGYLTGFDDGLPELHITELDHLDWARRPGLAGQIKRTAMTVRRAAQRECEG